MKCCTFLIFSLAYDSDSYYIIHYSLILHETEIPKIYAKKYTK